MEQMETLNTESLFSSLNIGDLVQKWSYDVLIDGRVMAENIRVQVKAAAIHLEFLIGENTLLADEKSEWLVVRIYRKLGGKKDANDRDAWTDIEYKLDGMKTVLVDMNGLFEKVLYLTQVFRYSDVKICHSK
jgi:hypothetical protein